MEDFDRRALLAAAGLVGVAALAKAGPITPPSGPVSSTSKSIAEVEPRIAINSTNIPGANALWIFRITQPGSYYLPSNIACFGCTGILIDASDVTIDLNGFAIIGGGVNVQAGACIDCSSGLKNITIRNGTLRDAWLRGISALDTTNCRVENVLVAGCVRDGIYLGDNAQVLECVCVSNGSGTPGGGGASALGDNITVGSNSIIRSCLSRAGATNGINSRGGHAIIQDCTATDSTGPSSTGILASHRTIVRGCAVDNCTVGIRVNSFSRAEACTVGYCSQVGILCDSVGLAHITNNHVVNCGSAAGHAGIRLAPGVNGCTVENNRLESNYRHIDVPSFPHLVLRNSMAYPGGGGVWSIAAGNAYGPLVVVGAAGDISTVAASGHPQANFTY